MLVRTRHPFRCFGPHPSPPSDSSPIAAHGGVFLARGGRYVQLEGRDRARNVVARFPSLEAAVACYNSPEYQAALAHAKGASVRDLMVLEESS